MTNKIIIVFMAALLVLNFAAWNKITVENDKTIKNIYTLLESCEKK